MANPSAMTGCFKTTLIYNKPYETALNGALQGLFSNPKAVAHMGRFACDLTGVAKATLGAGFVAGEATKEVFNLAINRFFALGMVKTYLPAEKSKVECAKSLLLIALLAGASYFVKAKINGSSLPLSERVGLTGFTGNVLAKSLCFTAFAQGIGQIARWGYKAASDKIEERRKAAETKRIEEAAAKARQDLIAKAEAATDAAALLEVVTVATVVNVDKLKTLFDIGNDTLQGRVLDLFVNDATREALQATPPFVVDFNKIKGNNALVALYRRAVTSTSNSEHPGVAALKAAFEKQTVAVDDSKGAKQVTVLEYLGGKK